MKLCRKGAVILVVAVAAILAGCSGGTGLDATITANTTQERGQQIRNEMTEEQRAAVDWASRRMTDADEKALGNSSTLRKMIDIVANRIVKDDAIELAQAEKEFLEHRQQYDQTEQAVAAGKADIDAVKVTDILMRYEFMGPDFHATITNPTNRGFSWLTWRADIYIDGEKEPLGSTTLTLVNMALKPGGSATHEHLVVGHDAKGLNTVAMREAKSRRFVLTPIYEEAQNFRGERVVFENPFQKYKDHVDHVKANLAEAAQMKKIATP